MCPGAVLLAWDSAHLPLFMDKHECILDRGHEHPGSGTRLCESRCQLVRGVGKPELPRTWKHWGHGAEGT